MHKILDRKPLWLNLGCGDRKRLSNFVNIDIVRNKNVDIVCDVRRLPMIHNNSVDLIYASHILEYFDRVEVAEVLVEWRRVLKTRGILRLAVPDFEQIALLYHTTDYGLDKFIGMLYGRQPVNGKFIYHKTCYDEDSLRETLERCGFEDIRYWDWRKVLPDGYDDWSISYLPRFKKSPLEEEYRNGTLMSLNMEAIKA